MKTPHHLVFVIIERAIKRCHVDFTSVYDCDNDYFFKIFFVLKCIKIILFFILIHQNNLKLHISPLI
jgi:hypothetical protein